MTDTRPAAAAFPRTARLLLPAAFKSCFESGHRLSGRYFRLHLGWTEAPARIGLAVSRKVSPRAVVRNRIKRCVRESFRQARAELPSLDIVVLAKREAAAADNSALNDDLRTLWRRLAALKRPGPAGTMRADSADARSGASDRTLPAPADGHTAGASRSTPE